MGADALDYYGRCRTANGKGVTIPSQHRYIHYFAQCMHEGSLREPREIFLTHIRIKGVPEFDPDGGCQPYIIISRATWGNGSNKVEGNEKYGLETVFDSKAALAMVHYRKQKEIEFPPGDDLRLCVPLTGDIFFEVRADPLPPSPPSSFEAQAGCLFGIRSRSITRRWGAAQDEAFGLEGQDDVLVLAQHVLPGGRLHRAPQGRDRQVPPGASPCGPVQPREFLDLSLLSLRRRT